VMAASCFYFHLHLGFAFNVSKLNLVLVDPSWLGLGKQQRAGIRGTPGEARPVAGSAPGRRGPCGGRRPASRSRPQQSSRTRRRENGEKEEIAVTVRRGRARGYGRRRQGQNGHVWSKDGVRNLQSC
jgi:hypothetical protein